MDVDEFYREKELAFARKFILENNIKSSSVDSFFHLKSPIWRSKDTTRCAFITQLSKNTQLGVGRYPVANVDPTRRMGRKFFFPLRHCHFGVDTVAMYHMNFVRKDGLQSKLANSSTTNTQFLDTIRQNIASWQPGCEFIFPGKGTFKFDRVANEFATYEGMGGKTNDVQGEKSFNHD